VKPCVALLGGSFDPVHNGHIALGVFFGQLLQVDQLRVIPAGNPWQKQGLQASAADRVAMLQLAFATQPLPFMIDQQEIARADHTSYTIDTLRAIRAELGPQASIVFLMGADQLQQFHTWRQWQQLFDYAHICAASRPGFSLEAALLPSVVRQEFSRRAATPQQIRAAPQGMTYLATNLAVDISATDIRTALRDGHKPISLVPPIVLDYIEQHHLYKS
jgi:nicotinate-nucleotide adenylyltransferase